MVSLTVGADHMDLSIACQSICDNGFIVIEASVWGACFGGGYVWYDCSIRGWRPGI